MTRRKDMPEGWLTSNYAMSRTDRTIKAIGDVDEEMLSFLFGALHTLGTDSRISPVTLMMHTGGGTETEGLAIYDLIRMSPCPVDITVMGCMQSMGAIILQAARTRYILPNSYLMIHVGSRSYEDHIDNVRRRLLLDKKLDEVCDQILLRRMQMADPKLTLGKLRDMQTLDTYFTAAEAVRAGLVDSIVGGE